MKVGSIITVGMTLIIMLLAPAGYAQEKPIQLAFVAPIQIFSENTAIAGIRISLCYGRNTSVTGLDWGLINHTTRGKSMGVQFGFIGLADADYVGWQGNGINITKGNVEGLQWGAVNYANYANGLQLGLVNYAVSMRGIQIGLINIIKQNGQFPVFPIVNWSF